MKAPAQILLLGILLATACAERLPPAPRLLGVLPERAPEGVAVRLAIAGENLGPRVVTDFGDPGGSSVAEGYRVHLGPVALESIAAAERGLEATVPDLVPPGSYDLVVTDPWGRQAALPAAFEVVAEGAPVSAAGFRFEPIGPQTAGAPFAIDLRAIDAAGELAATFSGEVALRDRTGTLVPSAVSLSRGLWQGLVEIRAPHTEDALTASDLARSGTSNPFPVRGLPAAGLRFPTPELQVVAGLCAPATLALVDDRGEPVPAPAKLPLVLETSDPLDVALFADPECREPLEAPALAAGAATLGLHVWARVAGPLWIEAQAPGLSGARLGGRVEPATAARLVWDPVASPVETGVAVAVRVRAEDPFGNLATGFAGAAALSLLPEGEVDCVAGCGQTAGSATFVAGAWSGRVAVASPGPGRRLLARAGTVEGSSAPFDALATPAAPLAAFAATPAAAAVGEPILFDASASTDGQTPAAALEVSWDFGGEAPGPPPWTPWTTLKTASYAYPAAGTFAPRLAVRDADGSVGYASRTVVAAPASARCVVTADDADQDDGATGCEGPFGPDGRLSLGEAIRLANYGDGSTVITFDGARTLTGSGVPTLRRAVRILAPPGVVLDGVALTIGEGEALLAGMELRGAGSALTVREGASLVLHDAALRDGAGLTLAGTADLVRASLRGCGARCVLVDGAGGELRVRNSELRSSARAGTGILLRECGAAPVLDLQTTVLAGFEHALLAEPQCRAATQVRHATFADNAWGVRYAGGGDHVLSGCVFVRHTLFAAFCPGTSFARRDASLLHENVSAGCVAGDPDELSGDPRFVNSARGDWRLRLDSPARDSAPPLGLDLNGEAPGAWFGAAPDRGARESP